MLSPKTVPPLVIGIVLWILFFPGLLLVVLPFYLLRWGSHFLASIFRPDLIPITSPIASFMATAPLRPNANNNVGQMWMLKGKLDVVKFRHHFHDLFLSTPQLRKQYRNFYCYFEVWGLYTFKKVVEEEELDLEDYIKEYKGPSFKDEGALEEFMGKWHNSRKEEGKMKTALWEMLVIYLQEKDESVLLFKIDHGLNDGFTFVNSVGVLTGNKAPYSFMKHDEGFLTRLRKLLSFPYHFPPYVYSLLTTGRIPLPNYSGFHNASQNEWDIGFTTLDLDLIKKIRKVTGARVNTILSTIQTGAMRRHCVQSGKDASLLPVNTYVMMPGPWPAHFSMMEDNVDGEKMGNHFTLSFVKLPFREESAIARLELAQKDSTFQEHVGTALNIRSFILPLWYPLPNAIFLKIMEWNASIGFGLLDSTSQYLGPLMLSCKPHKLMGLEVLHLYLPTQVTITAPSVNVFMAPISSGGRMDVTVSAAMNIFKDWKELDRFSKVYLKDELEKLAKCVLHDDTDEFSKINV